MSVYSIIIEHGVYMWTGTFNDTINDNLYKYKFYDKICDAVHINALSSQLRTTFRERYKIIFHMKNWL